MENFIKNPPNWHNNEIVEEFMWSWNAYKKYAWGKDELLPISKRIGVDLGTGTWIGVLEIAIENWSHFKAKRVVAAECEPSLNNTANGDSAI